MTDIMLVHATAVAIDGWALVLRGPSGVGKSDLALRLIDGGARLVADDQVELRQTENRVWVRAPAALAGLIEIRGIGILRLSALDEAPLAMAVDLLPSHAVERLPERRFEGVLGISIPVIGVSAFEVSAAAKVRLAFRVFSANPLPAILY